MRETILENRPEGYTETMGYGTITYVVPLELYHMGLYLDESLMDWFKTAYPKHSATKLDIGKSGIRFKKMGQIPFELIGELAGKVSTQE